LALLFEEEQTNYYNMAIDAFTRIIDEQKSNRLFGYIRGLSSIRIEKAKDKVENIKRELH
jgi:hypothetical protein